MTSSRVCATLFVFAVACSGKTDSSKGVGANGGSAGTSHGGSANAASHGGTPNGGSGGSANGTAATSCIVGFHGCTCDSVMVHDGGDAGEACVNFCAGNSCLYGATPCNADAACPSGMVCVNGCCLYAE